MRISVYNPDDRLVSFLHETGYPTLVRADSVSLERELRNSHNFVDENWLLWFSVRRMAHDVAMFNFAASHELRRNWTRGVIRSIFDTAFGATCVKSLFAVRKSWVPHSHNAMRVVGFVPTLTSESESEYVLTVGAYMKKWWGLRDG